MRPLRTIMAALVALAMASSPVAAAPPGAPAGRALLLSDIHFDPLDDPSLLPRLIAAPASRWSAILQSSTHRSLATYGRDSNFPLLQQALDGAAARGSYDFVIYTGDALPHGFATAFKQAGGAASQFPAFALKTQLYLIDRLQSRFGAPVFLALGNNDSDCGDYHMAPGGSYLAATARALKVLAKSRAARRSFAQGGYYAVPHPVARGQQIIVLNSVLWSSNYSDCHPTKRDAGAVELDWLHAQLAAAQRAGKGVTLVMHVPGGMDAYASSHQGSCTAVPFVKSAYAGRLALLLHRYGRIVRMAFAGHTHMDDFRLPVALTESMPLKIVPAVSPLFYNNPAFATFSYNAATAAPLDVSAYYLPLASPDPAWTSEYRFTAAYGTTAFDRQGFMAAIAAIRTGGGALRAYQTYYASTAPSPITQANVRYYTCAQTAFSASAYRSCVCGEPSIDQ